ncbi:hypothetical protein [Calothrix sp. UHCC 0171]|uniref:hypothetical protein n=1 Tax=Calothrix sp. UHCC 0171 TaxID=3110245 RepID=UPI002B202F13|nr:hypothetical protein [Calothrix sp. UHCC 0171]MEA5571943.1 hypothetical protein [Calothrix sp. UHCC 0171]
MRTSIFLSVVLITGALITPEAKAASVCGEKTPEAKFRTTGHLVTICPGEASFQMVITYHDGSGYIRVPANREGGKFSGSDGKHNYIIDSRKFIIGTDGEQPKTENVTNSQAQTDQPTQSSSIRNETLTYSTSAFFQRDQSIKIRLTQGQKLKVNCDRKTNIPGSSFEYVEATDNNGNKVWVAKAALASKCQP